MTSSQNAVAPYDFEVRSAEDQIILIDVKTTSAEFGRKLHISLSELELMSSGRERYDIYRVYDVLESTAKLRIAENVRAFAHRIISVFANLPDAVSVDGISVNPKFLKFGGEIDIYLTDDLPE